MDDGIGSETDVFLYREIQEKQEVLDRKWKSPRYPKRFIGSRQVREDEWEAYVEQQKEIMRNHIPDKKYTSTGEEWEIDCDGEYTPKEFWDK